MKATVGGHPYLLLSWRGGSNDNIGLRAMAPSCKRERRCWCGAEIRRSLGLWQTSWRTEAETGRNEREPEGMRLDLSLGNELGRKSNWAKRQAVVDSGGVESRV